MKPLSQLFAGLNRFNDKDRQTMNELAERHRKQRHAETPAGKRAELEELRQIRQLAELRAFKEQTLCAEQFKLCAEFLPASCTQAVFAAIPAQAREFMASVVQTTNQRLADLATEREQLERIFPDQLAKAQEASDLLLAELASMSDSAKLAEQDEPQDRAPKVSDRDAALKTLLADPQFLAEMARG